MLNPKQIREILEIYAKGKIPPAMYQEMERKTLLDQLLTRLTQDVDEASQLAHEQAGSNPQTEQHNPLLRVGQIEAAVRTAEEVALAQAFEEITTIADSVPHN